MEWGTSGRERGHRIGDARYHEIYDVTPDGNGALICVREVEGTKYGVRTTSKEYYVVARHGRGVRVIPANKAVAAKAAKTATAPGEAIAAALGKAKLAVPAAKVRGGLPALVGSKMQIAWAEAIRDEQVKALRGLDQILTRVPARTHAQEETSRMAREIIAEMIARQSAQDWIDGRDTAINSTWLSWQVMKRMAQ